MEAVLATLRPKPGTFTQDFCPSMYDILFVESPCGSDGFIKHLPKARISFEEEACDALCKALHDLTGADLCGIKGKRATFVPTFEQKITPGKEHITKGTLYCIPVNSDDKLDPKYVDNLPGSPGFYPLDRVLHTLYANSAAYNKQSCQMLRRLESWLKEKHGVPGAINLLFSPSTEDRLKLAITNPAYFTEHQLAFVSGNEMSDIQEGFSKTLANEALARMMEIEKCDIIKINTLFGQDLPYRNQVDACAVNRFWGLGTPDYSKLKVSSNGNLAFNGMSSISWVDDYPMHKYAYEGNAESILALIKSGYDVTTRDHDQWTPIHYAAWFGHLEAIEVLLSEGGCSPNITNENGSTPLHLAASKGHCYVIELLLNHKDLDLGALDKYSKSALDLCDSVSKAEWQDAAKLLRGAMSKPTPTIKVFLMDGTSRTLNLLSAANTTVQQLNHQMIKLQLKPEHKPTQHLNDWKRKIVQLLTNWDPSREDPQLFWRRHASLTIQTERLIRNPIAINLLFHEAYHNYIKCLYPCSNEDAVIMGGILMQLYYGDYDQRKGRNYISSDQTLKKLIPESKIRDKSQNWTKELQAQYKHFSQAMGSRDRSPHNARPPSPVYIGVNDLGVHIISVQTKIMLQTFSYESVEWKQQGKDPVLEIKLKGPTRGGMHIITKQAGLVDHLMRKMAQLNEPPLLMSASHLH